MLVYSMANNLVYYCIITTINFTISIHISNCLVFENEDLNHLNGHIQWNNLISSVSIKYCDVEITDSVVKMLMNNLITIMVNDNIVHFNNINLKIDYLVFINSDNDSYTDKCLKIKIPQSKLVSRTMLIIYDTSQSSVNKQIEDCNYWQHIGAANVLYIKGNQCWQASPSYMFNRTFSKVQMCYFHNQRIIPNMQGQTIEAVTFHRPLSTIIHFNETDPSKRYDGIEMKIFMEIARKINSTWRVNELNNDVNKWGKLEGDHWIGGMMEALTNGSADIGFSTIWMSSMHIPYLDYTTSWNSISRVFLVPKPTLIGSSWTSLFRPFTEKVWYSIIMVLSLFPIFAMAIARLHFWIIQQKLPRDVTTARYYLYTLGTITGGSGDFGNLRQPPLRFLVAWWYVFVLLLCNTYTSNIVADITLPSFTTKINTVQQLVEQGFSWGVYKSEKNINDHLDVIFDLQKYWHTELAKRVVVYGNEERKKLILEKRIVISAQIMDNSNYLILDYPIEDDLANFLRVMKEQVRTYRCAIAVRKYSRLLPIFDMLIQRLIESGLIQYLKDDAIQRFRNPMYEQIIADVGPVLTTISVLTLNNYKFMFYILIVGWITSCIFFLIELYM